MFRSSYIIQIITVVFFSNVLTVSADSPTLQSLPENGKYCSGDPGAELRAAGLEDGFTYRLQKLEAGNWENISPDVIPAADGDHSFGMQPAGTYRLYGIADDGVAGDVFSGELVVTMKPLPTEHSLINTADDDCVPVVPGFLNSQDGVTYRLYLGGTLAGTLGGNGGQIFFDEQQHSGIYTAYAEWSDGLACPRQMPGTIDANKVPRELEISPADDFCAGQTAELVFRDTELNTTYYVMHGTEVLFHFNSTGGGDHTEVFVFSEPGAYTIEAVSNDTGCKTWFEREIIVHSAPEQFPMQETEGCPGMNIVLSGCEPDVDYYLHFIPEGKKAADDLLKEESLKSAFGCDNGIVNFGKYSQPGTYTIRAVHGNGCQVFMSSKTIIHRQPKIYNVTGADGCVNQVTIGLSGSEPGAEYVLYRNNHEAIETVTGKPDGGPVQFSLQNHAGTYSVKASYTTGHGCTRLMNGTVELFFLPQKVSMTVDGEVSAHNLVCSGQDTDIGLDDSEEGVTYKLRMDGNEVSSVTGTGDPVSFGTFSGTGVYSATAHRAGCSAEMEGMVIISDGPADYLLGTSATSYCEGDSISTVVTLSNSQQNVLYTLKHNGTDVGEPVKGTGNPVSWTGISMAGSYHVEAVFTGDDGCPATSNSIQITEIPAPHVQLSSPDGSSQSICQNEFVELTFNYSGTQVIKATYTNGSQQYEILLDPGIAEQQSIRVYPSKDAVYSLEKAAYRDAPFCGANVADGEQIVVDVSEAPSVFSLSGQTSTPHGTNCAPVVPVLNGSKVGVQYGLFREDATTGGQLIQSKAGSGAPLMFDTLTGGGRYYVEAWIDNCSRMMNGTILVNARPDQYSIIPSGTVCSYPPNDIRLSGSQNGVRYSLFRNNELYSENMVIESGQDTDILFQGIDQPGVYTVYAQTVSTGCQQMMNDTLTVTASPKKFSLKPQGSACGPVTIALNDSEPGVTYALHLTGQEEAIQETEGTGSPVLFDKVHLAGTYFVTASMNENACQRKMEGTLELYGLPNNYTLTPTEGNWCINDNVVIGLEHSDQGIRYELYRSGFSTPVQSGMGTAGNMSFNPVNEAGTYSVKAVNTTTGCSIWMDGEFKLHDLPIQMTLVDYESTSTLCPPIELGLDNTQMHVNYFLRLPGGGETKITGTGEAMTFERVYDPGTYTAYAYDPRTTCSVDMSGEKVLQQGPRFQNLVQEDGYPYYCEDTDSGFTLYLEETEENILYRLYKDEEPLADFSPEEGHGGIIRWENLLHYGEGNYYVMAYSNDPNCVVKMNNSYNLQPTDPPFVSFLKHETDTNYFCQYIPDTTWIEYSSPVPLEIVYMAYGKPDTLIIDPEEHPSPAPFIIENPQHSTQVELLGVRHAVFPFCEGSIGNAAEFIHVTPQPTFSFKSDGFFEENDTINDVVITGLCEGSIINLHSHAMYYDSLRWDVILGNGHIVDRGAANTEYVPSPSDVGNVVQISLTLTGIDACGPFSFYGDGHFSYDPAPLVDAGPDHAITIVDTANITNTMIDRYSYFNWRTEPGQYSGSFHNLGTLTPVYHAHEDDAGKTINAVLVVFGQDQCETSYRSDTVKIKVGTPVQADFTGIENRPDTVLCAQQPAFFKDISYFISAPHPDQYTARRTWDFGDGNTYISEDPLKDYAMHEYESHGVYDVTLIIESAIDKVILYTDTVVMEVYIRDCHNTNLVFPNALAPDHTHEGVKLFLPKGINLEEYELQIFDLNGTLVWETTEIDAYDGSPAEGWDGILLNGHEAPQGVYVYRIFARFIDGSIYGHRGKEGEKTHGTITLIR